MSKQTIAIVGLGRVGSVFLAELLRRPNKDIELIAVAENTETSGKILAKSQGIAVLDTDALIAMGEKIDILFDLTGMPAVRRELREKLSDTNNRHTIIATETIAKLIWSLIASDVVLPNVHGQTGY
ncbi:homoserine dehydrogenase [Herminiimonas fonticola]|uniref:Homoserine dehydrogenase-like protein n=1 Tax=Herminiimonas fonticola TaxID=303380 RepID=A0A4R6G4Z5_9BURK|nr:homoserine dehydrogenase [Herminiimonas fonticola]RBA23095.1 Homoserine dehydrogenase, NAD binding domain [Herminiimonas fonticola]TDN89463.1 homoserine dehydrogenase-like protein [Herminiimonas fonticola]